MTDLTVGRNLVKRWRTARRTSASASLTTAQQGVWLFEELHPRTPVFNLGFAARHTGPLDHDRLDAAVAALVSRHPALRSTFRAGTDGPLREVSAHAVPVTQWTDLRDTPDAGAKLAEEAVAIPFDLGHAPLVRMHGYRLADEEHLLVFVTHHLVCDGGSLRVLLSELDTAYADGGLPGPAPDVTVLRAGDDDLAYWKEQLAGIPVLDLPTDRPRTADHGFGAGSVPITLSTELVAAAERLAREEGTTLFTVLLSAYQLLLGRHTGQSDFGVGVPEAGRARPGAHGTVGLLANPLVLRADLSGRPSFRELVRRTKRTGLAALTHRDAPYEEVVAALAPDRGADRSPLFRTHFVFHRNAGAARLGGTPLTPVHLPRPAVQHDVELHLWRDGDGLWGSWDFNAEIFEASTAARTAERLRVLLTNSLATPDRPAARLDVHTTEDRAFLDRWGNGPRPSLESARLTDLFADQVERVADQLAVTHAGHRLTYRQLDERSNQLAHLLRSEGTGEGDVVGVQMRRTADLAVAMLGIIKAGAAYLPLDPDYPAERLAFMRRDSGARTVLTELDHEALDRRPATPVGEVGVRPDSLTHVLYTSGSTGTPKAVMLTHAGTVAMVRWGASEFTAHQLSRVLASTSICFDVSVFEFFGPLCAGGTVVLVEGPLALLEPDAPESTLVCTVPSAARELVAGGGLRGGPTVFALAGEALPGDLVEDLYASGHVEAVYNLYGPSEDTTYSTYSRVAPGEEHPPIGLPLPHERAYVLDEELCPLPVGAVGELYLSGAGLARGYLDRPSLTASRFVADPFVSGERMYRTGDLVHYRSDGELSYLGRRDFQVKVRGQRIELGEIEAALRRCPGVGDAAVTMSGGRLVGYVAAGSPDRLDQGGLRDQLRRTLTDAMVPSAFVVLDTLPRTPNGKVDTRALPAPVRTNEPAGEAPRGEVEELVAGVWRDVLRVGSVGRQEDFFDLGGHSLLAGRVRNRLRELSGVDVPMRLFFERPVLSELAASLPVPEADPASTAAPLRPRAAGDGTAAATTMQRQLWHLCQMEPAARRAWTMQGSVRLTGTVRPDLLEQALRTVTLRHEALRTSFRETEGRLEQTIHPEPLATLERVRLSGESQLRALAEEAVDRLDLNSGPLMVVHLTELGERDHALLLTAHHIIADGWSLATLGEELGLAYTALCEDRAPDLPELPVQYADYAAWQREALDSGALEPHIAYWRRQLEGVAPLELRTDRLRPAHPSYEGALVRRQVPADLAERVRAHGTRHGASPYMVMLTVFLVLLHRHSEQEDIAVGSPVAGRNRGELERLIGFFLQTLVLRAEVHADDPFSSLLGRVRQTVLDALDHQDAPFEAILDAVELPARGPSRTPLFDVMFNYLNQPAAGFSAPGLRTERTPIEELPAKYDLELYVEDQADGTVDLLLSYGRDLFERDTAEAMLDGYVTLLGQVATDPELRVSDLRLTGGTGIPLTPSVAPEDGTVAAAFLEQVALHPDRPAVWTPDTTLSYAELEYRARLLGGALRERVPVANGRVGVLCGQGVEVPVALLGITAGGHAYVPLDTSAPTARLSQLAELTGADAIVTDRANRALAEEIADGRPVLDVNGTASPPLGTWTSLDPDAVAYVLFTSGSTGEPKAIEQSHRNVARHVYAYASVLGVRETDRLSMLCAYTADGAGQDLYSALVHGATACPMDLRRDGAEAVREALSRSGATIYHSTPSAFRALATVPGGADWPTTLRTAAYGGEKLTLDDIAFVQSRLPDCSVVNVYGLTECSVALMHVMEPGEAPPRESIPIGRPIPGVDVHLRDAAGRPAELFGEIVCSGPSLALGYLDPDQTAAAFHEGPEGRSYRTGDLAWLLPDGTLELVGRRDGQVKLWGHRVETGEVEARLRALPGVTDAAVVPVTDPAGQTQLAGYFTGPADPPGLRAQLYGILPHYMVPRLLVPLAELPYTRTAKVSRTELPAPDWHEASTGSAPPRTDTERAIADVFGEVLEVAAVGRQDNFFDLGGQSLQAARLVGGLRESLGVEVSVRQVFELGTVERIAAALVPSRPVIQPGSGGSVLSYDQQRLWLEDQLRASVAYNVHGCQRLLGDLDVGALERSIRAIIARHETLRTTFPVVDGATVQAVADPDDTWCLATEDLSGVDGDRESAARELTSAQAATVFDLANGPLFHCLLIRLGEGEHMLSITIHHIVSDAWSIRLFLRELSLLYEAGGDADTAGLAPLPVQYRDYASWQRQWLTTENLEAQIGYWRQHLEGAPPALHLPTARRRTPAQGTVGSRVWAELSAEEAAALHERCRASGVTPYMLLLTALATVLRRWSGQDDLVVGVPVTTRHDVGTTELIGFFVNTLPLRVDLSGDPTFDALLGRVRKVALEGYAHNEDAPFDVLVSELQVPRDPARTPLFQVILNMVESTLEDWELAGISVRNVETPALPSKFDLTLTAHVSDSAFRFELVFHEDRYDDAMMRVLLEQLRTLVSAVSADPTRGVLDYPLGDDPQIDGAEKVSEVPRHPAVFVPEAVAVTDGTGSWTYAQVFGAADRVARALADRGEGDVAVIRRRTAGHVVTALGCARAGTPFSIMEASPGLAHHPFISAVLDPDPAEDTPDGAIDVRALLQGTAGEAPTAWAVPEADWTAGRYDLGPRDRFAVLSGGSGHLLCAFHASLGAGGTLALPDEATTADPDALTEWLRSTSVTVLHLTPPQLRALAAHDGRLPSLRYVFLTNDGGLLSHDVDLAHRMAPLCRVVCLYRMTATGRPLAVHDIPTTWSPETVLLRVPVGTAVDGPRAELVNTAGRPLAVGEVGEIRIGTRRTGDLGRLLTDGTLEFVGSLGVRRDPVETVAALRDSRPFGTRW